MHRAAHSCRYFANAVFLLYYVLVQLNWLTSRAQRRDLQKENPVKTWKKNTLTLANLQEFADVEKTQRANEKVFTILT